MKAQLPAWMKKVLGKLTLRKRAPASPLARLMQRIFCVVYFGGIALFVLWRILLGHEINSRFAALRAAGMPASGSELNTWHQPVPDAENGALVMTQAFALFHPLPYGVSNDLSDSGLFARTNEWPPATRAIVAAFVQTNAPVLAKAREALRLSRFRYPVDFSYWPNIGMTHFAGLRGTARVAALGAVLHADAGQEDEWVDQIGLLLRMAATIEDEPNSWSHLAWDQIIRVGVRATERCLNRSALSEAACLSLQAAFARAGQSNSLPRILIGERAQAIPLFRQSWKELSGGNGDQGPGASPSESQRYMGKPATLVWITGICERDLNF